ncbi:hypothetical protein EVAR_10146_1 [Eumeta japonica]|uniref:Uncharacterized protein n=1 Tax=Eumeta variegata TaxID=151549 RepID=A0A4C1UC63_EUMVA|nr:hypothetical protein EVAR_10146_1 [Eumeta japonica]
MTQIEPLAPCPVKHVKSPATNIAIGSVTRIVDDPQLALGQRRCGYSPPCANDSCAESSGGKRSPSRDDPTSRSHNFTPITKTIRCFTSIMCTF